MAAGGGSEGAIEHRQVSLDASARELGVPVSRSAVARLGGYVDLLLERNRVHNLTGITDPVEAWEVLVLQSLVFLPALVELAGRRAPGAGAMRVVDVGAGAGVPSIPLALAWPGPADLEVLAIESRGKKAECTAGFASALGLSGYRVLAERAEVAGRQSDLRDRFDAATARAVGSLAEVLEYCLPLVRVGGEALIAKSFQQVDEELPAGQVAARTLGASPCEVTIVTLRGRRTAMVRCRKRSVTPAGFPRRAGLARSHPLGGS